MAEIFAWLGGMFGSFAMGYALGRVRTWREYRREIGLEALGQLRLPLHERKSDAGTD